MDRDIQKLQKDIVKIYKQIISLTKNIKKLEHKIDSTLEIVKSFDIVLTQYVDEEIEDEPEENWNPYESPDAEYEDDDEEKN